MGIFISKPRQPNNSRNRPSRQPNGRPGRPAPQQPVAPPASPKTITPTARSSLEDDRDRAPSLRKSASRAPSRSGGGLGFDPSMDSLLSKGTGKSNHERSLRTWTPSPSPSPSTRTLPETQTDGPKRSASYTASNDTHVQQLKYPGSEPITADQGVPQTRSIYPGVHKSETTNGRGARSPQAGAVSFPQDSRPGNTGQDQPWSEKGGSVKCLPTPNTVPFGTASGDTPSPPSIVVSSPPPTPHVLTDAFEQPETPAKAPLEPPQRFLHHRQRSVFKKLDWALRFRLPSKTSGSSLLKPSASVRSLPVFTDPDPESLPPSKASKPQSLHRLSLNELRDGLVLTSGKRSKRLDALDCTGQLSGRTKPQFTGGFSDVSQAKLGNRVVAVKALRATNTDGPDEIRMRKRLAREIYVWAALDHPHVLELLGFAFEDGIPCLISPWCANGTLHEFLNKYPSADRRPLVRQVAEGLKYLHVQTPPIIHGDFKTPNVLVNHNQVAKICDFGGSRRLEQVKTGLTTAGLVLNTIRYSAPEILSEGQHPTTSSDVYSFACVALETMTDKCPFWKIQNVVAVITQVVVLKLTPSPEDHPGLDDDDAIWELLRRCWSHEPVDRPKMIDVCKTLAGAGYGPPNAFYLTIPEVARQPGIV